MADSRIHVSVAAFYTRAALIAWIAWVCICAWSMGQKEVRRMEISSLMRLPGAIAAPKSAALRKLTAKIDVYDETRAT